MLGKQRSAIEKAKYYLNRIDDFDEGKKLLTTMVKKAEKVLENDLPDCKRKNRLDLKNDNSAVDVSYSVKYGRCLVATRDIEPGEFVCVDKFYATSVNNKKLYAYCSHCLAVSWTTVPCDSCSFYMFCGEKCKEEAWRKYHDIECNLHLNVDGYSSYFVQLSIRAVIMGIKETGSIKKLRDFINEIEKCTGKNLTLRLIETD